MKKRRKEENNDEERMKGKDNKRIFCMVFIVEGRREIYVFL